MKSVGEKKEKMGVNDNKKIKKKSVIDHIATCIVNYLLVLYYI